MRGLQKWPDLSLRTKCLLLITFPAAATVLMFAVGSTLAARNSAASELVNRALETGQEIQRLRASQAQASAAAGAYFSTAQESFVSEVRSALAAADSSQDQLLN